MHCQLLWPPWVSQLVLAEGIKHATQNGDSYSWMCHDVIKCLHIYEVHAHTRRNANAFDGETVWYILR